MTHASLFTGIGGFDLAAEWMGWYNLFQVEKDKWCQQLLKQNFPHAERYTDIKDFRGGQYAGAVDVLSGGFPCQPYSTAGKRKGKEDDRHLWPEMLRVIREISPRWVVGENVRGLINWNGGVVFDEVQADLEAAGYEVLPFLLPAAGVNAPHRRDRIWFVAHSKSNRNSRKLRSMEGKNGEIRQPKEHWEDYTKSRHPRQVRTFANANERRLEGWESKKKGQYPAYRGPWSEFPSQSPVCRGNDGVPHRVDRIKGLGNAVVPQVVYQIFKAIEQYEFTSSIPG